jgi:uncharacterized glyoxalase superfamily protein PhnB
MACKLVVPILRMFDESRAREFYVDFLEFRIDWEHRFEPEAPLYAQLSRDECRLHLSEHHGDVCPGAAIRIEEPEVETYQQALLAKNYKYYRPGLIDTEWHTREMTVQDPFGNKIIFWKPLPRD